jgi:cytochrome c oxidase assembly factor CtaG
VLKLLGAPLVWSVEPVQLAAVLLAAALYARRAATLHERGRPVAGWRLACFAAGLVVLLLAFVSPIDTLGEERLFWVHMLQHVLIGDVAPLLVVFGLTGPLLRPLLALRVVARLRVLVHPLVALPLWAADLAMWHLPRLYDAALAHSAVHALQHGMFFACGALVWSALLEPLPGPRTFTAGRKLVFLAGMWFYSLALSQVFLWSRHPFYPPYVHAPRTWGMTALADQRLGGGVMLVEGSFVMLGVLIWLALRWFAETEARQRLLDAGIDPETAARAARYGRA